MTGTQARRIRQLLVEVTASITAAALNLAEIDGVMSPLPEADVGGKKAVKRRLPTPHVDPNSFCVEWDGHVCFLGATVTFRLLECLARRPNRFASHRQLLAEVWDGHVRERVTIRSVVRNLRVKLRAAGMNALASAVVGHGQGYALFLRRGR
jgi:DNA-binding response OmpR family regulator